MRDDHNGTIPLPFPSRPSPGGEAHDDMPKALHPDHAAVEELLARIEGHMPAGSAILLFFPQAPMAGDEDDEGSTGLILRAFPRAPARASDATPAQNFALAYFEAGQALCADLVDGQ